MLKLRVIQLGTDIVEIVEQPKCGCTCSARVSPKDGYIEVEMENRCKKHSGK